MNHMTLNTQALLTLLLCCLLSGCWASTSPEPAAHSAAEGLTAEWPTYGGPGSDRFSPLNEINIENVQDLEIAWRHDSGDKSDGSGDWSFTSLQVTPIAVNDTLYYCTPFGRVFALNPATGEERWVFDPEIKNTSGGYYPALCRGVSYWEGDAQDSCDKRIVYGTRDAELIALDADTGQPCPGFGKAGRVALREGISEHETWEYYPTSPPVIIDDKAVIGALVVDNLRTGAPSGVVRAFDIRTGELAWAWDPVSEDYKARHQDQHGATRYHQGTPNVWAPMSADHDLNLVLIPTGNPSPDLYGGERDGIDEYGSSVVALDARSGRYRWHFQTVHHDVWDFDVAAQPTLFQIPGVGQGRRGIAQGTKTGMVFLLDRETGKPLYPVEERPVPQNGVPGEKLSPTQPFATHPAPLHFTAPLTEENVEGLFGFGKSACQELIRQYRSEGIFTPPSLEGSVLYPANMGGINWGSVAINPGNGLMFVNQMHFATVVQLIPRQEYDAEPRDGVYPLEYFEMKGTPYGALRTPLVSNWGAPCVPKPWGSFTAVDLKSGEIKWRIPLGTTRDLAPFPLWFNTGVPNVGGALATAGDLVFIGATTDRYLRAFDQHTGEEVWRQSLPFTANATPMTYQINGRQYLVVAAGGHGWSEPGDALIAFALP
ncbi:quinoprotein glucose dehydrogenase [Litorivivens lipolytica]|uniref:Quinoprotein glucose dehydrogenase n=1 Tax=Litorivivens lipolytica TaxID=1524264 RepID=A0A7W4Z4X2_9GAMM|nr:pyrroloquinoline quinone-dependent dehydrogenase [Litorivivens lipolytica]MBB3046578.1 quinoprotein glucose dehydrogenase [Litorivivens lipolytica]